MSGQTDGQTDQVDGWMGKGMNENGWWMDGWVDG